MFVLKVRALHLMPAEHNRPVFEQLVFSDRRPSGPVEPAVLRGGNVGQPYNLANPILVCLQQRTNNDREGWHIRLNVDREQVFCLTFMFSITMVTSVVLQCS